MDFFYFVRRLKLFSRKIDPESITTTCLYPRSTQGPRLQPLPISDRSWEGSEGDTKVIECLPDSSRGPYYPSNWGGSLSS